MKQSNRLRYIISIHEYKQFLWILVYLALDTFIIVIQYGFIQKQFLH